MSSICPPLLPESRQQNLHELRDYHAASSHHIDSRNTQPHPSTPEHTYTPLEATLNERSYRATAIDIQRLEKQEPARVWLMKRAHSSTSQSPPRESKKGKESAMEAQENSPPGPSAATLPAKARMAIENFLTHPAETVTPAEEKPLSFLAQDDLCVKQPFEIYLTYAQALSGRHEELAEVERTLAEADALMQELSSELEKAENARPRRARIIGPIRTRIQGAQSQHQSASERVESAKTKVAFSENTMRAMTAVLLKFGWRIQHDGDEIKLEPHPSHPEP